MMWRSAAAAAGSTGDPPSASTCSALPQRLPSRLRLLTPAPLHFPVCKRERGLQLGFYFTSLLLTLCSKVGFERGQRGTPTWPRKWPQQAPSASNRAAATSLRGTSARPAPPLAGAPPARLPARPGRLAARLRQTHVSGTHAATTVRARAPIRRTPADRARRKPAGVWWSGGLLAGAAGAPRARIRPWGMPLCLHFLLRLFLCPAPPSARVNGPGVSPRRDRLTMRCGVGVLSCPLRSPMPPQSCTLAPN
jgi:hypothetical protein